MKDPSLLLTNLATILCLSAPPTLRKLSRVRLPSPTLVVSALPDISVCLVFATEIAHDDAGPVLHIVRVSFDGEFLDQGKDVEGLGEEVFVVVVFFD